MPSDPTEEQKARHRARAEHYSALSRRGDPEHRCNATEEDFDAGWLAARASDAPPNEEAVERATDALVASYRNPQRGDEAAQRRQRKTAEKQVRLILAAADRS